MIDGPRLLLTPLQHELVPPPMALAVALCPAPVQSVSFRTAADGREVRLQTSVPSPLPCAAAGRTLTL